MKKNVYFEPVGEKLKSVPEEIDGLIQNIRCISDKEYQLSVWYRAERPRIIDFFEETYLQFFESMEMFEDYLRKGKITFLGQDQIREVQRLHDMIESFGESPESATDHLAGADEALYIINHPAWDNIRQQAKHVLEILFGDLRSEGAWVMSQ